MEIDAAAIVAFCALILTTPGATVAAGVVNRVVEVGKRLAPTLLDGREKHAAFVISAALVALAVVIGLSELPPRYDVTTPIAIIALMVGGLLATYNIARLAMATADDLMRRPGTILEPSADALAERDAEIRAEYEKPPIVVSDRPPDRPVSGDTP